MPDPKWIAQYELSRRGYSASTGVWFNQRFHEAVKRWNRIQDNESTRYGGSKFRVETFIKWLLDIWEKLP